MNNHDNGILSLAYSAAKLQITADEDLADLIPGYLDNCRDYCREIKELLDRGDFDPIRAIAHGIKGSGGLYGFNRITEIGTVMESAAKAGNKGETRQQMENLEWYLARVEVLYA